MIATTPVVPASIQHIAQRRAGSLAYIPTRAPFGYRYLSYTWNAATKQFAIRLHDKHYAASNTRRTVSVTAAWFNRPLAQCGIGNEKSYQVGGNKVFSAGSALTWRCVQGAGGRIVRITSSGQNMPTSTLAIVASSVRRV
ncbi:MAG TPA: hypothetical protein VIJ70_00825 [Gaiellaceae bacterium]